MESALIPKECLFWKQNTFPWRKWPENYSQVASMIFCQTFPKRMQFCLFQENHILFILIVTQSKMNGMIFRSFRKRNRSQKNMITIYSENTYSKMAPKEHDLTNFLCCGTDFIMLSENPDRAAHCEGWNLNNRLDNQQIHYVWHNFFMLLNWSQMLYLPNGSGHETRHHQNLQLNTVWNNI